MIDAEDRRTLLQLGMLLLCAILALMSVAVALGLAFSAFKLAGGL